MNPEDSGDLEPVGVSAGGLFLSEGPSGSAFFEQKVKNNRMPSIRIKIKPSINYALWSFFSIDSSPSYFFINGNRHFPRYTFVPEVRRSLS